MPYPNRAQWLIIWAAFFLIAWVLLPQLFASDGLTVLREQLGHFSSHGPTQRVVLLVVLGTILLLWQASRWTLKFKRPSRRALVIAVAVVGGALMLVGAGVFVFGRRQDPKSFTVDLKEFAAPRATSAPQPSREATPITVNWSDLDQAPKPQVRTATPTWSNPSEFAQTSPTHPKHSRPVKEKMKPAVQ